MLEDVIDSVQSSNCSDEPRRAVHSLPPKKKSLVALPDHLGRSTSPAWLSHRTLPPLRQTRMPLRAGRRPRAQVLPLCQLSRPQASTGVHPSALARPGHSVTRQLPEGQEPPRRHLRHQPRDPSKERGAVANGGPGERGCLHRRGRGRHRPGSDALLSPGCRQRLRNRATGGKR